MERRLAQLHVGHHRQSQGRGLQPPRRRALGLRQRHAMGAGHPSGLSLDPADVPLQRLVLPLDAGAGRRHLRLPAPRQRQDDLRRAGRPRRHAHVRRTHHHAVHHRRHGGRAPAAGAQGRVHDRRRAAARRRARGAGEGEFPRHPRLRPDRGLWPGDDLLVARGLGCAALARARPAEGAPGRALCRRGRRHGDGPDDDDRRCRATAPPWAR